MKHTFDFDLEKTRDHFYPMFTTVKTRSPRRAIPQMPITEKSAMTLGCKLAVSSTDTSSRTSANSSLFSSSNWK